MSRWLRFFFCVLLVQGTALFGAGDFPEKTTQYPGGVIVFPRADAKAGADNSLTWSYKPTRWGRYEIEAIVTEDSRAVAVDIEIGEMKAGGSGAPREVIDQFGFPPRPFAGLSTLRISRFYLADSERFNVRATSKEMSKVRGILLRPAAEGSEIVQKEDAITLHARDATTHSVMMRYEPAENKNCLGYWTNPNDMASWSFAVTKPGTYEVELWQGCGKGQGGSVVSIQIDYPPQTLFSSRAGVEMRTRFVVEDTGHFQNFIPRNLGQVTFREAANYNFFVRPLSKKAAAVMDIRKIVLKPAAAGAPARNPALESVLASQRVVFLGDSITYSGEYIEYLETYMRLRHPEANLDFINLGLPSETVSGLSEPGHAGGEFPRPNLHERLERVLEKAKPDIIIACYGMNDGIYHPYSEERAGKFYFGMLNFRERARLSGAHVIHLTPPVFDPLPLKGRTLPAGRDEYRSPYEGYNEVLDKYSERLVGRRGQAWEVIDVHTAMNQFLAEKRKAQPDFILAGDGVHANAQGHWIIAREILRYLGAPEELTSAPTADALLKLSPRAPEILKLVQQRQRLLKDAWLTEVGHQRPGMNKGKPLAEAEQEAAALVRAVRTSGED